MIASLPGHAPVASTQTPLSHSVSAMQPRQAWFEPSQTAPSLPVQSVLVAHSPQVPSGSQIGLPATPSQSVFVVHDEMQKLSSQIGVAGSVQSAEVVHCGATQAPFMSQTLPPLQLRIPPEMPNDWHSASLVQHASGLGRVHARAVASDTHTRSLIEIDVIMAPISAGPRRSC